MAKLRKGVDIKHSLGGVFNGRKVLVTGHTGFKGAWLSTWLIELGAEVIGYSLNIPTQPSFFEITGLEKRMKHIIGDVRDLKGLEEVFNRLQPDIVFHLAAQSITRLSYDIPVETFSTNILGTVNVLECLRTSRFVKAAVIVTSDKCYYNSEWEWGYRENDRLGGSDPYSTSKACAELVAHSYYTSYFSKRNYPRFATVRAGNVIGGGDWAQDRVIPDCLRAWDIRKKPMIRKPEAIRPWLYVLEPLSGYLWLAARLIRKSEGITGESFNFGPDSKVVKPVKELVSLFLKKWNAGSWQYVPSKSHKRESTFLKLCSDKALYRLSWHSILDFEETVELTAAWYRNYYKQKCSMHNFSCGQIRYYAWKALKYNLPWTKGAK